eukprot:scaffold9160_cov64-Cylindrotheca_fusiformis.AAC.2
MSLKTGHTTRISYDHQPTICSGKTWANEIAVLAGRDPVKRERERVVVVMSWCWLGSRSRLY